MSETDLPDGGVERRRHFRIEDSVHLTVRPVAPEALSVEMERLDHGEGSGFTVLTRLHAVGQQLLGALARIEQRDPDVADCLRALDRKVELLGQIFLASETGMMEVPPQLVSLSAGGIAFDSVESYPPGTILEVKLLLEPSFTGIMTFGEVVACESLEGARGGARFQLRVNFSHLRDADEDALIRHLLRRQGEMLRARRRPAE